MGLIFLLFAVYGLPSSAALLCEADCSTTRRIFPTSTCIFDETGVSSVMDIVVSAGIVTSRNFGAGGALGSAGAGAGAGDCAAPGGAERGLTTVPGVCG